MQKCFVVPSALLKCCTPKTHLSLFVKCKPRKVHIGPQLVHGIDHCIGGLAKKPKEREHTKKMPKIDDCVKKLRVLPQHSICSDENFL